MAVKRGLGAEGAGGARATDQEHRLQARHALHEGLRDAVRLPRQLPRRRHDHGPHLHAALLRAGEQPALQMLGKCNSSTDTSIALVQAGQRARTA